MPQGLRRGRGRKVVPGFSRLRRPVPAKAGDYFSKPRTVRPVYWGKWSCLRDREGLRIGKNRDYRLLCEHRLLATQTRLLRARRGPLRDKPRTTLPNRVRGIYRIKICVAP